MEKPYAQINDELREGFKSGVESAITRIFEKFGYDKLDQQQISRTSEEIRVDLREVFLPETLKNGR